MRPNAFPISLYSFYVFKFKISVINLLVNCFCGEKNSFRTMAFYENVLNQRIYASYLCTMIYVCLLSAVTQVALEIYP